MAFRTSHRVRFGECDPSGLVYGPRFFHYFHTAMEELFAAALGIPYAELTGRQGLGFPSVRAECEFHAPLRQGELAEIEVAVERLGETSCTFRYRLFAGDDGTARAEARVVTVCTELATLAKRPIPAPLRAALAAHLVDPRAGGGG